MDTRDEPQEQGENRTGGKRATQFRPGQSGNPSGRPKGRRSIAAVLQELLEADNEAEKLACARSLLGHLKSGNGAAIRHVFDRVDGPITQRIVVEIGEGPATDELLRVLARRFSEEVYEGLIDEWHDRLRAHAEACSA